jgi:HEAT repeat protein
MVVRSRLRDVDDLVRRLGSRQTRTVNAARARLVIIGARAVDALVDAVESDHPRRRANAMTLLALIQDKKGREALAALLFDKDPRTREAAALSLSRFSCEDAAMALERLLRRERDDDVRVAAVRGLVEVYGSGQDAALAPVLAVLFDPQASPRSRIASLSVVALLRPGVRRSVLRRLRQDPSPELARVAEEAEDREEPGTRSRPDPVEPLLEALSSEDWDVWNDAVRRLAARGPSAVVPLVEAMRRRAHDPEYCARAGIALKALGPRRVRMLAEALDQVDEPLPLQVLVEVVGSVGEKALLYRLKDLIDRLRVRSGSAEVNGFDPLRRVRARAHLELARIGSRCAIADLRDMLSAPDLRVEVETVAAAEMVGKKDEIPDLLRAWKREDRAGRRRITEAVRTILRRERIRRNSRALRGIVAGHERTMDSILGARTPRAPSRRRIRRKK